MRERERESNNKFQNLNHLILSFPFIFSHAPPERKGIQILEDDRINLCRWINYWLKKHWSLKYQGQWFRIFFQMWAHILCCCTMAKWDKNKNQQTSSHSLLTLIDPLLTVGNEKDIGPTFYIGQFLRPSFLSVVAQFSPYNSTI